MKTAAKSQCDVCGKKDSKKRCTRCRSVVYCSKRCQRWGWPTHSKECFSAADEKEPESAEYPVRETCGICLQEMPLDDASVAKFPCCLQRIHFDCLRGPLLSTCPFCRTEVYGDSIKPAIDARAALDPKSQKYDQATAVLRLIVGADNGDLEAMWQLASLYKRGEGVAQSDSEAFRWWAAAAERGDRRAQYNAALSLEKGDGTPRDDAEARRFYLLAYAQGHAQAGECYHDLELDRFRAAQTADSLAAFAALPDDELAVVYACESSADKLAAIRSLYQKHGIHPGEDPDEANGPGPKPERSPRHIPPLDHSPRLLASKSLPILPPSLPPAPAPGDPDAISARLPEDLEKLNMLPRKGSPEHREMTALTRV